MLRKSISVLANNLNSFDKDIFQLLWIIGSFSCSIQFCCYFLHNSKPTFFMDNSKQFLLKVADQCRIRPIINSCILEQIWITSLKIFKFLDSVLRIIICSSICHEDKRNKGIANIFVHHFCSLAKYLLKFGSSPTTTNIYF